MSAGGSFHETMACYYMFIILATPLMHLIGISLIYTYDYYIVIYRRLFDPLGRL